MKKKSFALDFFAKEHNNLELFNNFISKQGYILLYGEITDELAENIVAKIKTLNLIKIDKPIILNICSNGGNISAGLSIVNAILSSEILVHTIISGEAASMAGYISVVGKKRYIYKNSFWMNHPLSAFQEDDLGKIKDRTQYLLKLDKELKSLLEKHTKLDRKDYRKIEVGELWLTSDECLKKGIVDNVL